MRSKRFLAMLLALCMVLSVFSPAAFAVEAGADTVLNAVPEAENNENNNASNKKNDLLVSVDGAADKGVHTQRENSAYLPEVQDNAAQGNWEVTPGQKPSVDLMQTEAPACLEELKEAAKLYSVDEVVRAFVVMEDAPLAETHKSPLLVSNVLEQQLIEKQDAVIAAIERTVLQGQELNVRYQFTYLTNAFSIETEFANLEKIARISGVKSVFIVPVYEAVETESNPNTAASGAMTGVHSVWQDLGYTGVGMKIAIIDTGLDLDHPSFGALNELMVSSNENYLDMEDIAAVLPELNAFARRGSLTAEALYRSTKVPYAFNYCDNNLSADHSADAQGDHGTHVAGIAAANKTEGTSVVGMAPDAQIIVMKVFGANGGAYADDYVAAIEDAMKLGCDAVNLSLGSPAGFSESSNDWYNSIFDLLAEQNIIATISAGNEGPSSYDNAWGTNQNRTQNPDNATIGSPSLYDNAFSIASAENCEVMTPYFALADETKIFFSMSYEWATGQVYGMDVLIGQELEYVVIDGLGYEENFYDAEGNSLVEGKVAVVMRGTLNFGTKVQNAENAGAVACVLWNNNDIDDIFNFYPVTEYDDGSLPNIPVALVSLSDGYVMQAAEVKTLCVAAETAPRQVEGGQMSSFSSWGPSPDLRLVPDITGIGGNVYSCYDGGVYGVMSGTSMSAPQVAGVSALVLQYLYDKHPDLDDGKASLADIARNLLMSTADPIISSDSGVEASPRQQGAGLIDAAEAVKSGAYLTILQNAGDRPKAELGDNNTGNWNFSFQINNISNQPEIYTLSASLLTEAVLDYGFGEYFMAGYDMALSGKVTFSDAEGNALENNAVAVPAGDTVTVNVRIELSDKDKFLFAQYWENGGYVEGYVYLENANEHRVSLNLPFMGFYGDWTDAPVFDGGYWYDSGFWGAGDGWPTAEEYYHVFWTSLAGTDWVLGFNPYSGPMVDANYNIIYDPANNSLSPNGDGVMDGFTEIYLSLLRNAKTLTFEYTVDGEPIYVEEIEYASKTMYRSNYGQVIPWIHSWYVQNLPDFTRMGLANDTKVLLTIRASVDYGDGGENVIEIPFTIDTQAPELLDVYQFEENGSHYLAVVAEDNVNVGGIFLMNRSGSRIYGEDYCVEAREDGSYMAIFNVDELGTELMVVLGDYAGNEGYYNISYTEAGENVPDMTPYTDLLFAYRTFDEYIYSDHMYGWVSMNKPSEEAPYAGIGVWTDDYMEYAAINAAEYVDGKIFAVDAVGTLVVMEPGLFDRKTICNLGENVLDMTFDDSTDTMYVLTKETSEWGSVSIYLKTMDLLTGELTQLKNYSSNGPRAIADDDNGTVYAIKDESSSIYTIDFTDTSRWYGYKLLEVTDADGNPYVITDSTGEAVSPSYAQSMTYVDGKLYWAYFQYGYWSQVGELITIDTETWTSTAVPYLAQGYSGTELVTYSPNSELVGLLTLAETEYQIPASDAAHTLLLDSEQVILGIGAYENLSASWLPWNYALDESQLVWTSADESIATVEDGKVTAISEGITYVTVTYGDLSATCQIIVVDVNGHFNAYNYYSGDGYYGYMIDVDMTTMDYLLMTNEISPVDFMAGDYNGHDGYFYGYDAGGQFYRYDIEANEVTPLGAPLGTYPVDMAYNYATGMMYVLFIDYTSYENTLYAVNMANGNTLELAKGAGLMNLACSTDGLLYGVDAYGTVCEIVIMDYSAYGSGIQMVAMPVLEETFGELYMLQSICWDHNNDVLLWNWCEGATVLWIDVGERTEFVDEWSGDTYVSYENGYYVNLGDPSGSGVVELVGMHVVPDEIDELPDFPVESLTAEDMVILTGYEKVPAVTVAPFNATSQNVELTIADPTIVELTENGALKGLKAGTTTVTADLTDAVSGVPFSTSFTVTVIDGADNVFGHILTDMATGGGQAWVQLNPGDPGMFDVMNYFDYTIFSEEQVDGKIYTYGYDGYDWEANMQFFVLDEYYNIETQIDMGESFPFVYDMTYDYVTSTMYALAGVAEDNTELYVVDMETGNLILLMELDELFLSLTAGPDGKLYAMQNSEEGIIGYDDWGWEIYGFTNAKLWSIDPMNGTKEMLFDTGVQTNMISSMAYDYDTDTIYWTPCFRASYWDPVLSGLYMINPETEMVTNLGTIGTAGAQVGGLYILCEEYPEAQNNTLHNVLMSESKKTVMTGASETLAAVMIPGGLDAEMTWTSSDETIATVENGVVTGVAQGSAVITVTATYEGVTKTASCKVAVLDADAAFLTWNATDKGWSLINRWDYSLVTNLTEGEETNVLTIANVGNDVYGYDENNQLFKLDTKTFARTIISENLGLTSEEDAKFCIREMAYDAANERMLVLVDMLVWDDYYQMYCEVYNGCTLYTVDLTTGALTELYNFDGDYNQSIRTFTVGNEGQIYFYYNFNDDVVILDLSGEAPAFTKLVGLQSQSIYGNEDSSQTLHYDALTNTLYMLITTNGRFYKMATMDALEGTLIDNGEIGELVEKEEDGWYYNYGDSFAGMVFVELPDMELPEKDPAEYVDFTGADLSLEGMIGLNFYANICDELVNDADAYAVFSVEGTNKTKTVLLSELTINGEGKHIFSYKLPAKNLTDVVTVTVFNGAGEAIGETLTYSAKQYCDTMKGIINGMTDPSAFDNLVDVMNALLNYGAAAQNQFGYNVENLVNAELSAEDKLLPENIDLSAYAHTKTGAAEGLTVTSAMLQLEAQTVIRIYFTLEEGKSIEDYDFFVGGVAVTPVAEGNQYYIEKSDIAAKNLDKFYTFQLGDITLNYCGLSYAKTVLDNSNIFGEELQNMVKALYAYNQAANAYFE